MAGSFSSHEVGSFVTVEQQIEAQDNAKMDAWLATPSEAARRGLVPPDIYHSDGTEEPSPDSHPGPDGFHSRLGLRGAALSTKTENFPLRYIQLPAGKMLLPFLLAAALYRES